jgi:hypothetical protein
MFLIVMGYFGGVMVLGSAACWIVEKVLGEKYFQ